MPSGRVETEGGGGGGGGSGATFIARVKVICRLISVEPVIALFCLGYGLLPTADNALMYEKTCLFLYNDSVCASIHDPDANMTNDVMNEVQRQTSRWQFYQGACESLPYLLTSLLFGSYGDVFGRKVPIIIAIIGSMYYAISNMILAIYLHTSPGYILIGAFVYGASGGLFGLVAGAFGHVTSVASTENRTLRTVAATVVLQISEAIGYTLSGILLDAGGYVITYICGLFCYGAALIWTLVLFSQSKNNVASNGDSSLAVDEEARQQAANQNSPDAASSGENSEKSDDVIMIKDSSTSGCKGCIRSTLSTSHVRDSVAVLTTRRENNFRQYIVLQIVSVFIYILSSGTTTVIYYLFLIHPPLSFTSAEYGIYMGCIHVSKVVGMLAIVAPIKRLTTVSDTAILVAGGVSATLSKLLLGLSVTKWMAFLSEPVIGILSSVPLVCMRSLLSTMVQPSEIGKVMSLVAVMESSGSLCASYLYAYIIYPLTVDSFPGAAIVTSAGIMLLALAIFVWLHIRLKQAARYESLNQQGGRLQIVW